MSDNSSVVILIKAPNQLVDDQAVHCERNWTVKKLKQHLYHVYPCKPHPDGQKLIYSGQLLSDDALLSDILRTYEGHENNTIHLVCSVRDSPKITRVSAKPAPQPTSTNRTIVDEVLAQESREQNANFRNPGSLLFPPAGNNPQTLFHQSVMFQQAYMQYLAYFNQRMVNGGMGQFEGLHPNPPYVPAERVNIRNGEVAQNTRGETEAEDGRDEPHVNRDWLEWFYILSRLFILFTVVYFYSSPQRFILVIAMALILINIDVFRWRRGNNNVEGETRENETVSPRNEETSVTPNHFIKLTWTFMKTFFLSLVPDNREV